MYTRTAPWLWFAHATHRITYRQQTERLCHDCLFLEVHEAEHGCADGIAKRAVGGEFLHCCLEYVCICVYCLAHKHVMVLWWRRKDYMYTCTNTHTHTSTTLLVLWIHLVWAIRTPLLWSSTNRSWQFTQSYTPTHLHTHTLVLKTPVSWATETPLPWSGTKRSLQFTQSHTLTHLHMHTLFL